MPRLLPAEPLATLLAVALAAGAPLRAQESLERLSAFQTPSGNIHCEEWKVGGPRHVELRCDILDSSAPAPVRPKDCELDYGSAFMLSEKQKAWRLCHGDTVADPKHPVLAYGAPWQGTGMTCVATVQRLRCTNRDGHGFALSRRSQRLF